MGADVLKNNPHINDFFVIKNPLSLLSLFSKLKKKKIKTAFFFHTSQRILLPFCAAVGINRLIGTLGLQKGLDDLLTDPISWKSGHEIERRLDLVKNVGAKPSSHILDFFIQEKDRKDAEQMIPESFVIGLHPGAKDKFKQWSARHFIQVGQQLQKQLGCTIIVTESHGSCFRKTLSFHYK
jgi:ADP-heptose:LPS heptosyltransferase